jgi:DNA polymerase V
MFALVDCNNFFVSCERVFNPRLRNCPVIVLSNNDGCAVARSNEAKKLGIKMGAPLFTIRELVRKNQVQVLSSNFSLYGDLSARVMSIITQNMPEVEIYSIDEAFVDLTSLPPDVNLHNLCVDLVQKIQQYTGIPVSIGIGATRTLAKVANHIAKTQIETRVYSLDNAEKTRQILQSFPVGEVWGIGRQWTKKLQAMSIKTVAQLIAMPDFTLQHSFNIVMQRLIQELRGVSCIKLHDALRNKQRIMVSRSFGHRLTDLPSIQEALATYVGMACAKLRQQNSITSGIYVFLNTGLHGAQEHIYKNTIYIPLPIPTADTRVVLQFAKCGLKKLFKHGYRYKKTGVILCDLSDAATCQFDIFNDHNLKQSENLMQVLDNINATLGRSTMQFAAAGLDKNWKIKSGLKSQNFIGKWDELPLVHV